MRPSSTERVCPSCGAVPGPGVHCDSCGANLAWRARLPSRAEWEAANGAETTARPAGRVLRYSARDLEQLRVGPGEFMYGTLALALLLDEELGDDEEVKGLALGSTGFTKLGRWVIVTSERVLVISNGSVAAWDHEIDRHARSDITECSDRRVPLQSWLKLTIGGERRHFFMLGRGTAHDMAELLAGGSG